MFRPYASRPSARVLQPSPLPATPGVVLRGWSSDAARVVGDADWGVADHRPVSGMLAPDAVGAEDAVYLLRDPPVARGRGVQPVVGPRVDPVPGQRVDDDRVRGGGAPRGHDHAVGP